MPKMSDAFPAWPEGGGIFSKMVNPPWLSQVPALDLDLIYYTVRSGEKEISPLVTHYLAADDELTEASVTTLARVLLSRFGRRWSKLWETLFYEYNPIHNYNMDETGNSSGSDSETGSTSRHTTDDGSGSHSTNATDSGTDEATSQGNAWAYNVNLASRPDGDPVTKNVGSSTRSNTRQETGSTTTGNDRTETGTDSKSGNRSDSHTLHREGNIGVTTTQQMIGSEREVWLWDYFRTVFEDVDSLLTLPLYDLSDFYAR